MSLEINKICRTCLALEGALLSIYDSKGTSGGHDCVADMLGDLTSNPPKKSDGMPEKVCIACISEINRCYTFKMRCDNSDRTLRQILNITKQPEHSEDHQVGVKQMNSERSVPTELADEKKKPQKAKADHSLKLLHDEVKPEPSGKTNEGYSVPAEAELDHSYFAIRAVEKESEDHEVKQKTQSDMHIFVVQSQKNEDEVLEHIDDADACKPPVRHAPQRNRKKLKCPFCPITFVRQLYVNKHIIMCHYSRKVTNTQSKQPLVANKNNAVDEVSTQQLEEESENFKMKFQSIKEATAVVEDPHLFKDLVKVEMRSHNCPYCGASFALQMSLTIHIKWAKCTAKQYSCSMCQKLYISNESLTNDHPFVCDVCKVFSTTSSSLVIRKLIRTAEQPYACNFCPVRFFEVTNLARHRRMHTGENRYKCKYCELDFARKINREVHMRTHTGEKPYKCKYCKVGFAKKSDYNFHIRTHPDPRSHICQICGSAFFYLGTLRTHMKIIHNPMNANAEEVEQSTNIIELVDSDEEMNEDQSQEQMDEQKKSTSTMEVTVDLGEDDILNFAIEESSSENNDFIAE